ncbi:MAG: hypothetical protein R3D29_08385 [Nitratireductor sp.]
MSGTAFEEFAEAVASQKRAPLPGSAVEYTRIAVLGGGSDAQLLSAICLSEGAQVTLFSAYGRELEQLRGKRCDDPRGRAGWHLPGGS